MAMPERGDHLSAAPPARAVEWARREAGADRVVSCRPLRGGASHANHVLRLAAGDREFEVVLRRWARPGWARDDPWFSASQEAATYRLLATAPGVPAPALIGVDPDGSWCDVPAIAVTRAEGRRFSGAPNAAFVQGLASPLPALHAVDPAAARAALPPYRPYHEESGLAPPAWSRRPGVWRRAIAIAAGPAPAEAAVFVHRDYHPGNTLWAGRRLSSVVDWTTASFGPPGIDLAHMRANLAMAYSLAMADSFLAAYAALVGRVSHDPYWDIRVAVDLLPDLLPEGLAAGALERLEDFVAEAVESRGPLPPDRR